MFPAQIFESDFGGLNQEDVVIAQTCRTMTSEAIVRAICDDDIDAVYQLVLSSDRIEFDRQFFSSVTVTKELVQFSVDVVKKYGCDGISSIGCGSGFFEWFLAKAIGRKVHCVDTETPRDDSVFPYVAHMLDFEAAKGWPPCVVPVPDNHLLLFVWGTRVDWQAYLSDYKGRVVMFVHPDDLDDKVTCEAVESAWNCKVDSPEPLRELDAVVYARRV